MQEYIAAVETFQKTFKRPIRNTPSLIPEEDWKLRLKLIEEEVKEYKEACETGDLVEIADALGDQLYILFGTIIEHGLQHVIEPIFNEIQRSNMSKLDDNGQPLINGVTIPYDDTKTWGKVLKSVNFTEPNIKQFL